MNSQGSRFMEQGRKVTQMVRFMVKGSKVVMGLNPSNDFGIVRFLRVLSTGTSEASCSGGNYV